MRAVKSSLRNSKLKVPIQNTLGSLSIVKRKVRYKADITAGSFVHATYS